MQDAKNRLTAEPAPIGTEPTAEEVEDAEIGTDPDPESDSDEEQIVEPVSEGQRRRYPLRERRAPWRFPDAEHVLLTDEGERESFEEAKDDTHRRKWLSAMQDEMDYLHDNHMYELVELPKEKRALRNKWVYKLKPGDAGKPPRYKARIVVKGCCRRRAWTSTRYFPR